MNNLLRRSIITVLAAFCAISLASCGDKTAEKNSVQDIIEQASQMSRNDLYKKAMEELDGKTMNGIGNSSRGATAQQYFIAYLQGKSAMMTKNDAGEKVWSYEVDETIRKEFPDYDENFNGEISWQQPKNNSIFTMLDGDIKSSNHTFSMTLIQDANQIQSKMLATDLLLNYIPKDWNGVEEINGHPYTLQSLNKVFEYNNLGTEAGDFKNVWQFVEDGKNPQFMGPNSELVGKNFLMMLTEEKYAQKVKDAYLLYKDDAGAQDFSDLITKYADKGEVKKYGYAWIDAWINAIKVVTDDGPIAQNLVQNSSAGESGLLVYSKLRSISETDNASKNNITVAAYQDGGIEGFGGFMYKHYLLIPKTSPMPWTACAFIEFMTCTTDGFSAWGADIGGYCSNPDVNQDHSNDGAAINHDGVEFTALNDRGYDWWKSQEAGKGQMVIEDPTYLASVSYEVGSWIDTLLEDYNVK